MAEVRSILRSMANFSRRSNKSGRQRKVIINRLDIARHSMPHSIIQFKRSWYDLHVLSPVRKKRMHG